VWLIRPARWAHRSPGTAGRRAGCGYPPGHPARSVAGGLGIPGGAVLPGGRQVLPGQDSVLYAIAGSVIPRRLRSTVSALVNSASMMMPSARITIMIAMALVMSA
jgi:hypothetical protein